MHADSFFVQGITHEVCEDYATAGPGYAIISDGCSNGGGPRIDTDWGSRLICKAAESNLALFDIDCTQFLLQTITKADLQRRMIDNISGNALAATLLLVKERPEVFQIFACGDGFYGGRKRDGTWVIHQIEYVPGGLLMKAAPFYPIYFADFDNRERYITAFGSVMKIHRFIGNFENHNHEEFEHDFTVQSVDQLPFVHDSLSKADYDFAFVATDGIGSFYELINNGTSRYNQDIPPMSVLEVLLGVLNNTPSYLKLNKQWAFRNRARGTFLQKNWHNSDDVAMGGLFDV